MDNQEVAKKSENSKRSSDTKQVTIRDEPKDRILYSTRSSQVIEHEKDYVLSFDLPGVKKQDLTAEIENGVLRVNAERKSGKTTTSKFSQRFLIDEKVFDPDKLDAKLEDGVLTITVGKRETKPPMAIKVTSSDPPSAENDDRALSLSVDLPGVKLSDIKVELDNGDLIFQGERKRGRSSKIHKVFTVRESAIDTSKMQGYLVDGVLTIMAPARGSDFGKKKIALSDDNGKAEPAVKATTTENVHDDHDAVVVETDVDVDD